MAPPPARDRLNVSALEEGSGVLSCLVDELCSMREIDGLDAQCRTGRQDDQLGIGAVALDVVDQAAVRE